MNIPRIALPEINQNVENYTHALHAAGMEPVVISVQSQHIKQTVQQEYLDYSQFRPDNYDGLLLPGGGDVNPQMYGQENKESRGIIDELDALQMEILSVYVKEQKPVLGVCRGMQLINVFFGGTLIQHLPTACVHAHKPEEPDKIHACRAFEGSWLEELYGQEFYHISAHHQAVDRIGEGLSADSVCPSDGCMEALHHLTLPVYAVQWHPERTCLAFENPKTVNGLEVFRFFSRLCRKNLERRIRLAENSPQTAGEAAGWL